MNATQRGAALALLACLAGCSSGGGSEPVPFAYASASAAPRVGEPLAPLVLAPGSATPVELAVSPPLPAGLALDPSSATIAGTPAAESPWTTHVVSGTVEGAAVSTELRLRVGPALPAAVAWLAEGYAAEVVAEGLDVPVKLAVAPDGRVFFNELASGNVQVLDPSTGLLPAPFATLAVESGDHRGLLGLALAPDFAASGHVYVMATFAADGPDPARSRVLRFTDSFGSGVDETVIVDDLPVADIDNGGELLFDASGRLLVSVGDAQDPALAQDPGSLAGKLLRYEPDGSIPADNPDPASPVWCLGLRNVFALALHPENGGLFGADNGPDEDDELDFLVAGRNFGWGYEGEGLGAAAGYAVRVWREVIVPTGIVFHDGAGAWGAQRGALFLAAYAGEDLRRIELRGPDATDFHMEVPFLRFAAAGIAGKPLDVEQEADGSLLVSTFTGIYRVRSLAE